METLRQLIELVIGQNFYELGDVQLRRFGTTRAAPDFIILFKDLVDDFLLKALEVKFGTALLILN